MTETMTFADPRLATLDGFRVEIDPGRERAEIVLDRPPLNVIMMPQRDQLRLAFEASWATACTGIATAGSRKSSITASSMIPPAMPSTAETAAVSALAPQRTRLSTPISKPTPCPARPPCCPPPADALRLAGDRLPICTERDPR